jgi:hypothetical protein
VLQGRKPGAADSAGLPGGERSGQQLAAFCSASRRGIRGCAAPCTKWRCRWHFKHSALSSARSEDVWPHYADVEHWNASSQKGVEWSRIEGSFEAGVEGKTKAPGFPASRFRLTAAKADFIRAAVDRALQCCRRFAALPSLGEANSCCQFSAAANPAHSSCRARSCGQEQARVRRRARGTHPRRRGAPPRRSGNPPILGAPDPAAKAA